MITNKSSVRAEEDPRFTDIRALFAKYFYHWPLFLTALILAFGAASIYILTVNPKYSVGATILVKDEKKVPQERTALQEIDQSSTPKNAETEIQILRSAELVGKVVKDLGLWVTFKSDDVWMPKDLYLNKPFDFISLHLNTFNDVKNYEIQIVDPQHYQMTDRVGKIKKLEFGQLVSDQSGRWMLKANGFTKAAVGKKVRLSFAQPEKVTNLYLHNLDIHLLDKATPTIGIYLEDEVPERSKRFINYLIRSYNDATAAEERRLTENTLSFINDRLKSLTGELNLAEEDVQGYRSSQGLTDINSQSKVYLENVQSNDNKLNEVNVQLNIINGIERYVNSTRNDDNPPATVGISDPALNNLIDKLTQLQLKKASLLVTTPIGNPVYEPLNKQIEITKTAIKQNIANIKTSLLSAKRELQSFNSKFESSIKNIPGQERQFVGKKRQQSIKENLYVYLLQKKEEVSLSYAATLADARIVDRATVEDAVWPKTSLIYLIALIGGFGIPLLILIARFTVRNKVTDRRQIERSTGLKVAGEISAYDEKIKLFDNRNHVVSEQFKSLRTTLHYLHADADKAGDGRVTLLTSSVSKEGKSFVSSNLAASLAVAGRKTVILEMDLRKPKIASLFDVSNDHAGIGDFLASEIEVSALVQPTVKDNLFVISSGLNPMNPSELLESKRLDNLISILKEDFDDIIIDSPPLHLVTDAGIISRIADVTLYIVRQGKTGRAELPFIRETYENSRLPGMALIFNGVTAGKYGYGYAYDSSYYTATSTGFSKHWKSFLKRF